MSLGIQPKGLLVRSLEDFVLLVCEPGVKFEPIVVVEQEFVGQKFV